jgi:hypothetical protein
MLCRPSRQAHARRIDNDRKRKSGDINGDINKEEVLVLTTEFNFNYRVHDGVWISCRDLQLGLVQTPVLITSMLSPEGNAGICAVNAIYLYSGAYLRSTLMDYSHLIPDVMVGNNVWFLANKPVEITGARLSSAWLGVPVGVQDDGSRMVSEPPISSRLAVVGSSCAQWPSPPCHRYVSTIRRQLSRGMCMLSAPNHPLYESTC